LTSKRFGDKEGSVDIPFWSDCGYLRTPLHFGLVVIGNDLILLRNIVKTFYVISIGNKTADFRIWEGDMNGYLRLRGNQLENVRVEMPGRSLICYETISNPIYKVWVVDRVISGILDSL
jgi:hypothetical protein